MILSSMRSFPLEGWSNQCHQKILKNYQKFLNLTVIMGLQKGKTSDNQNDMGLVKCHHIVTNTAHGCATSEKCSKFLDILPAWG